MNARRTGSDQRNGQRPGPATVLLDERVESVAEARAWMQRYLSGRHLPDTVVDDAVLVVSELVTNALLHGVGAAVLRASLDDHELDVSVTDSGGGRPARRPADFDHIGGLGLHIVDRLAADWGVASFPGGKTVWAVIALPH